MKSRLKVLEDNTYEWRFKGKLHRVNGPAVIFTNGDTQWWRLGQLHKADGPAIVHKNGFVEWWFRGVYYPSEFEHQVAVKGDTR